MYTEYYFLDSHLSLQNYLNKYFPLIELVASRFQVDASAFNLKGDHIGVQVLSATEFDTIDKLLISYCKLVHAGTIHNRRNNIYKLNKSLKYKDVEIPLIEIFEPKPNADLHKLKLGIEHIAFTVSNYDEFIDNFKGNKYPIDKEVEMNGAKFFKTKFINLVEIEFRNMALTDMIEESL